MIVFLNKNSRNDPFEREKGVSKGLSGPSQTRALILHLDGMLPVTEEASLKGGHCLFFGGEPGLIYNN